MRVLFQGDSVTDAKRDRSDPHQLGNGYPRFAAQMLYSQYPRVDWEFLNQGISGNRTIDLCQRWQTDCLDYQPDVLSILVGVNDTLRRFDSNDPTAPAVLEQNYRFLLEKVKANTNAKIIMMEPFVLMTAASREEWHADLDPKIAVIRKLAREYADVYIPLDGLFAALSVVREPKWWAADGVHPTEEGAFFIAQEYVKAIKEVLFL